MVFILKKIINSFEFSINSSTKWKRIILLLLDLFILLFSIYVSFWIRLGSPLSQSGIIAKTQAIKERFRQRHCATGSVDPSQGA